MQQSSYTTGYIFPKYADIGSQVSFTGTKRPIPNLFQHDSALVHKESCIKAAKVDV